MGRTELNKTDKDKDKRLTSTPRIVVLCLLLTIGFFFFFLAKCRQLPPLYYTTKESKRFIQTDVTQWTNQIQIKALLKKEFFLQKSKYLDFFMYLVQRSSNKTRQHTAYGIGYQPKPTFKKNYH